MLPGTGQGRADRVVTRAYVYVRIGGRSAGSRGFSFYSCNTARIKFSQKESGKRNETVRARRILCIPIAAWPRCNANFFSVFRGTVCRVIRFLRYARDRDIYTGTEQAVSRFVACLSLQILHTRRSRVMLQKKKKKRFKGGSLK